MPNETAAPRIVIPSDERRLVSVLFADLVGFTARAETLDPEEVRELLSRYFDTARAIIERYGGTVEKFIGDAVMAVWGAPAANEDDAERAVRTALDLVEAVSSLEHDAHAPDLQARAGVLTGEAVVNLHAAGQGMVAGDLVNTASRLQAAAEAGTVVVGEATFRAASRAIAFTEIGDLTLKGKDEPVHAWRALRVVAQRRGEGGPGWLEPPFVGRSDELRLLKGLLDSTVSERRARLVSVSGIPGIGKSRLAWELQKYVDGLAATVYWHQGRSPAYGEGITFWALGEMVRMRAGITESEDVASSRAKLSGSVAEFVPDPDERRWIEPRLAHLLGLADAPAGEREELFSAWRTFFERIADAGPIVMVFEDLQWADQGLIDFVESILEWSRNHPIMVLALCRPELLERRPTWGAAQRNFTSLHLEPLSDRAMSELLRGLVHGLPDEVVRRVQEWSEGVPLYAVETVRMLVDREVLVQREGVYVVTGELDNLEIPDTLHALIASRLDVLPAAERSLLQDAAVLGQTFSTQALAVMTGREEGSLVSSLRDLVRKELLLLDTDPRSPERGQYRFVQGLMREVAYGTLAKRDKGAKHLLVAQHFEGLNDEELAGAVAAHYAEAHRVFAPGPERDALGARARYWLSKAGQRAMSLGSSEQALAHFEQAVEVAAEGEERAALLELAGSAGFAASAYEHAEDDLEQAIAYYEAAGDASAAGNATALLTTVLGLGLHRYSEAARRAERAFRALGQEGTERVRAKLAIEIARSYSSSGSPDQALSWSEMGLALTEQIDDSELLAGAIGSRASALFNLGRHQEAAILARGRVTLAEAAGSLIEQAYGLLQLSIYVIHDDPQEAMAASMQAAQLAKKAGHRSLETTNLANAAETAILLGQWPDARVVLDELAHRELPSDSRAFQICCEAMLTALSSDPSAASDRLEKLSEEVATTEFVAFRTTYLRARAMVELAAGDLEAARRDAVAAIAADPAGINSPHALALQARTSLWLRDAVEARTALSGMSGFRGRWMAAVRLTTEAGLVALEGPPEEAAATYLRCIESWRTLDSPLDLALCELDQSLLLDRNFVGASILEEAREILSRIDALPLLKILPSALELAPVPS